MFLSGVKSTVIPISTYLTQFGKIREHRILKAVAFLMNLQPLERLVLRAVNVIISHLIDLT
jgi:hypothetical protein